MRMNVSNVEVGYDKKVIVNDLTIGIPDSQITTIIGSNGCGKSTLLKAMTRIIPHQKGQIMLDGAEIQKKNTKELAKELAILPQTQDSAVGLLVEELVSYGRFPYQSGFGSLTKEDREIIDWALNATNTYELKTRFVDELSGGQKQRVWIAMALAQNTDIIFLDEPTTYLDMAHQLEVLELLQNLNEKENRTIVMVLHDLNHAARFSNYMIALEQGNLVKAGTPEEVMTSEVLKKVFNIDAVISTDPRSNKPICITYDLIKEEI
ncbi:ABC transporter ATP-binding protein [Ureibacillus chungkukjangi]|uniref:Iron complex transport system ATP-binding protein n=1 Tax=Ureibacillus chungkukjangi TaxID=1202712 RepID=A0A318THC6_9BACL|nr:ABC transporter ATP-binding protein [Ureibacillus chungkukjangi]MCM3390482.1 ABC transporter ATP-binding protein [Ureibacillus chungkukjangi]PYF02498.1 iron complex transport system ATP-binding protein [Ureibacillus chungkukjangi]